LVSSPDPTNEKSAGNSILKKKWKKKRLKKQKYALLGEDNLLLGFYK